MSEYIGARISLVSKSDIRYVGTLHEINSENSTVALENVSSFGTEGRRQSPEDEIAASDNVYEYIVFRGSDVKDLKIQGAATENKPAPPQVPNDPAILGGGARPQGHVPQGHQHGGPGGAPPQHQPNFPYPQNNPPFPPGMPQYGFNGPPRGFPYPGIPYGSPPGYNQPPMHGFPQGPGPGPGPFSPTQPNMPFGGPGPQQMRHTPQPPPHQPERPRSGAEETPPDPKSILQAQLAENQPPATPNEEPPTDQASTASAANNNQAPPPPVQTKPDVAAATAPGPGNVNAPTGPQKNGKIVPAVPMANIGKKFPPTGPKAPTAGPPSESASKENQPAAIAAMQHQNATTQAATAAVAAAMAKLAPQANQQTKPVTHDKAVDNLTQKVNQMRTDDRSRNTASRGGRGGARRGGRGGRGIDVPKSDFDFASANAAFNKQDLVKEAIASGSPIGTPSAEANSPAINGNGSGAEKPSAGGAVGDVTIPPAAPLYDSKSSFFDNISSENRDREEGADGRRRATGYEFRTEERKRNMETFGLGSVDGGYRGGYRGRGRARGGYRGGGAGGGGGYGRGGRGGYRGNRESVTATAVQ